MYHRYMRQRQASEFHRFIHKHIVLNDKERAGVLSELSWLFLRTRISVLFMCAGSILLFWLMPGKFEMYVNVIGLIALLLFLISWLNAERQGNHMPVFSEYTSPLKWVLYRHISILLFFLTFVVVLSILFAFA